MTEPIVMRRCSDGYWIVDKGDPTGHANYTALYTPDFERMAKLAGMMRRVLEEERRKIRIIAPTVGPNHVYHKRLDDLEELLK